MLQRLKTDELRKWKNKNNRKPLILRGARQVGKTSLVNMFAEEFDFFISLNLEFKRDREIFEQHDDISTILQLLFIRKGNNPGKDQSVLIFIDEIQNSPKAVALLRYFYEEVPEIYVIAAGSLLESLLSKHISFPVGRVEYLFLHPLNFEEFLMAYGNERALEAFHTVPFPKYGHDVLSNLFREYLLIGGMPEIVKHFLHDKQIVELNPIFDALILTYLEDVEKYAKNQKQTDIIRHIIQNAFLFAGQRIKFERFAYSNYKSQDVGACFRTLEKTFLLKLVYPTTKNMAPIVEDKKKSPKLQVLDTGIINKLAGLQADILNCELIDSVYEGKIAEHIVGQELTSLQTSILTKTSFWVREKKQSNAEIDFILAQNNLIIPIEVKSGKTGRLRSLMEFIDVAPHQYAIRIYSGNLNIDTIKTIKGKPFYLLNLPFYLIGKIDEYLKILLEHQDP